MKFKDLFASVVLLSIIAMIAAGAVFRFAISEIALGALIVWGGNIVQYYWRKKDPTP
ncbi:MAG: hypothetical protein HYY29_03730 [Chloroflexi bacterium]|nr:hypothetical protein [Chloroflexota bacterium]